MILVENSELYGRDEQGNIDISIETACRENGYQVVFKDSGPGIDVESRDDIFQPYFHLGTSGYGRGMGLSIAYQICRYRLDGSISYNQDRNLFEIELPLKDQSS